MEAERCLASRGMIAGTMRRLLRILLNAATVLSIVVFAATAAMWARTYRAVDGVEWDTVTRGPFFVARNGISTSRGAVCFYQERWEIPGTAGLEERARNVEWELGAPPSSQRSIDRVQWSKPPFVSAHFYWVAGFEITTAVARSRRQLVASQPKRILLSSHYHVAAIPLYAPAIASALLPASLLFGMLRRRRRAVRRRAAGQCAHCGYDCRATPERCPECGNVPDVAAIGAPARAGECRDKLNPIG